MVTSYKRLWKLLIDKDMKIVDFRKVAHLCSFTLAKLTKGEKVSIVVLAHICEALQCNVEDIMDILPKAE